MPEALVQHRWGCGPPRVYRHDVGIPVGDGSGEWEEEEHWEEGHWGGRGPQYGSCFNCGGPHFAVDCPHPGGKKGKGKKRGGRGRVREGEDEEEREVKIHKIN